LGVALVEMALAGNIGAKLTQLPQGPTHAALFGEDQARYLIAIAPETVETVLGAARAENIPIIELGVTDGAEISWPGEKPISLTELKEAFEKPLPAYMAGDDQAFA
jgi:phosphoribosylformylglycinamidine synthase